VEQNEDVGDSETTVGRTLIGPRTGVPEGRRKGSRTHGGYKLRIGILRDIYREK
jgi:hypothetical protein